MIFLPGEQIDRWLLEDIQGGDLTTSALGINAQRGEMHFSHRQGGCVSGIDVVRQTLERLGLSVQSQVRDGEVVQQGQLLLIAVGRADALHQGWKVAQNLLEWSCGVSHYLYDMLQILRRYQPHGQIACTRKSIPGTRLLAMQAAIAAGGIIHRVGCAETLLLFTNHRRFWSDPNDWAGMIARLRRTAPEKKIIVEADTVAEAETALQAAPDILQLDKFSVAEATRLAQRACRIAPHCQLSLAGGISLLNISTWAQVGIPLLITSAPWYASPADIQVRLFPAS